VCPECFSNLERVKTEKAKVVGISKVTIPALLHQEVPYFALVLEDEKGNKWSYKSTKEYAVGEELNFSSGNNDAVAVWKVKYDYLDAIENVFSLLSISLNENSKILILPTLFSPNHAYFRDNTSPQFLDLILKFLFENKVKTENVKIMAQSFDEIPIEGSAQKSGLLDVCLKNMITPLDLAKAPFIKKGNLEVSEEVVNVDIVLNLAMMKIGRASTTENVFKTLKKESYSALKYLQSEEDIANELKSLLSNVVNIGEAEFVQRLDKTIVSPGLILGSRSFLNLDRVFSEITIPEKVPEILKGVDLASINIKGRDVKEARYINN